MAPRHAFTALAIALVSSSAYAELAKLGDFALTDTPKKSGFAKVTAVLGCAGSVRHEMKGGKVVAVELSAEKCTKASVEAALAKEYPGVTPVTSPDGEAKLWEGKTTSVILRSGMSLAVRLVAPGPGAKRTCFADDGFAAFYKTFTQAVATNKADTIAASFAFPIKDFEGKVRIKDAKAFAKKWPKLIDSADLKELATLTATCDLGTETYSLGLSNSDTSFEARKVGDRWMWIEINDVARG
jgi:hypothetical protein